MRVCPLAVMPVLVLAGCGGDQRPDPVRTPVPTLTASASRSPVAGAPTGETAVAPEADHGPWSAAGPGWRSRSPLVAPEFSGPRLLVLRSGGVDSCADAGQRVVALPLDASGRLGSPRTTPGALWAGPASGAALVASASACAEGPLDLVRFASDGRVASRTRLVGARRLFDGTIASGPGGAVAAEWAESDADGSHLSTPVAFPGGTRAIGGLVDATGVALAVDAHGRTLVVTARPLDHVVVTTYDRRGRRLSRQDLRGPADETHVVAALGRDGRAVVAWGTADGGEAVNAPYRVTAAVREAGAARFGPSQTLDPGGRDASPRGRLRLALAADGRALLGWGNVTRGLHHPVRAAFTGPRGGFGPTRTLARDGSLGDVALGSGGRALVAWTDAGRARAAVRLPGAGSFGPAETVSAAEHAREVRATFTAAGRPLLAWLTDETVRTAVRAAP